jgi:hypothetical protein
MRKLVLIILTVLIFSFVYSVDYNVLISEVYTNSAHNGVKFIEFYNPLNYTVDISGWVVESYSSSLDKFQYTIPDDSLIPSLGFYLIYVKSSEEEVWPVGWVEPDAVIEFPLLNSEDDGLRLIDDADYTIDALGWGIIPDDDFYEECPVYNPDYGKSMERKSGRDHDDDKGNGYDTNNNFEDFHFRNSPEPQNINSPPETPGSIDNTSLGVIKSFFGN